MHLVAYFISGNMLVKIQLIATRIILMVPAVKFAILTSMENVHELLESAARTSVYGKEDRYISDNEIDEMLQTLYLFICIYKVYLILFSFSIPLRSRS